MKKPLGQRITRLLSETRHYRVLLFARENPGVCARVMPLTITEPSTLVRRELVEKQAKHLLRCADLAQTSPSTQVNLSKPYLKAELDKLKPEIVGKLEAIRWTG